MKKFIITGSSGFVSRYFIEYLENTKIDSLVKGLDISASHYEHGILNHVTFEYDQIDLLDTGRVEKIIYEFRPDYILHLASYSSVAFSWKEPIVSFQNNTNIFLNLLEAIRKYELPVRILSIGSSEEYGNVDKRDLPLTEDHSLNPVSPYGVARVSQELLSKIYSDGYGLNIIMTRSFNHIGPFQKDIFVISSLVRQLVDIKNIGGEGELIAGDLDIIRDFTDVRDVVSAYYMLLTQGEKGNIYNVCSGLGSSLKQIVDAVCDILGITVTIKQNPDLIRPTDNRIIIGSNNRIYSSLGWKPQYSLNRSLTDIIQYWQSQNKIQGLLQVDDIKIG